MQSNRPTLGCAEGGHFEGSALYKVWLLSVNGSVNVLALILWNWLPSSAVQAMRASAAENWDKSLHYPDDCSRTCCERIAGSA